jgi:hypothetical protein
MEDEQNQMRKNRRMRKIPASAFDCDNARAQKRLRRSNRIRITLPNKQAELNDGALFV